MEDLSQPTKQNLEKHFVRNTYDSIAEDFSSTRYKKWPKVDEFLKSLPKGSLVLDVGCGNGKYLDNDSSFNLGCDASTKLLDICSKRRFEVVKCDMMRLPFRKATCDAVICIAALHHLSSNERRRNCLLTMVDLLLDQSSQLLIQVWAYEQNLESNNTYLKAKPAVEAECPGTTTREVVINESLKLPVHKNRTAFASQDVLVPFKTKSSLSGAECEEHLRYYHVFKEGELEELIKSNTNVTIDESYYDRGNWCAIIRRNTTSIENH